MPFPLRSALRPVFTAAVPLLFALPCSAQQAPNLPRPTENPPDPPAEMGTAPPAPQPQKKATKRRRPRIGPQVGFYIPTNGRTRDRFGSSWFNIGFGVGNISDIYRTGHFTLDVDFISNYRSGERILIVPIGAAYTFGLGKQSGANSAYAGVSADLVVVSLRSDADNLPTRTSLTGGGAIYIGTRFSEAGYLEARYNAIGRVRGFELSGLNLTAGLRF
ncbi:MAG: hypothetical protein H7Z41_05235 [Cytophagales bacterium]|nr:hypothetical protein [Armatimonadota bacterium]